MTQVDEELIPDLEEIRKTDAYAALKKKLTDEQIVFVWRAFRTELCARCWDRGPYCCYGT